MDIVLKFIGKYWKLILIFVLALVVYWFYGLIQDLKDDNIRLMDNFEQIVSDNNEKILELTKSEFKKYNNDSLFNKLKDSLNLSFRHIEKTINHKYHHVYDTTITLKYTLDTNVREFNHKFDECVSVSGKIDWGRSLMFFDSLKMDYNSTSIYYWERPRKFWFIRFGRKKNFISETNNCTGESKITEISIKKKN